MSKSLLTILAIIGAVICWLMPLIYAPATPYTWGLLAIYTVLAIVAAFRTPKDANAKARDEAARRNLPALVLLLLATAATSCARPAVKRVSVMFPEPVMATDSAGWTGPKLVTAR